MPQCSARRGMSRMQHINLIQILNHRLVLEPGSLWHGSESPPVSLLRIQPASLNQILDTLLLIRKRQKSKQVQLVSWFSMWKSYYQVSLCTCSMKCGAIVEAGSCHGIIWVVAVVAVNQCWDTYMIVWMKEFHTGDRGCGKFWMILHSNREWFQESIQTIWLKHSLF